MKIHPSLILRTPKFSSNAKLQESWLELKEAIKISSASFYETVKDVGVSDLEKLPQKIQFTIWKYFNRAKFRATPYGTFAGFSFLSQGNVETSNQIVIDSKFELHQFIDWPIKNEVNFSTAELIEKNVTLISNASFYLTGASIRYIACTEGQFELAEIDRNDLVFEILTFTLKPIKLNDLITHLQNLVNDDIETLHGLIQDMLSLQLLLNDHDPNIIGDDYFTRLDLKFDSATPKYIIAERKVLSGKLNLDLFNTLPKLVSLTHQLNPKNEKEALKNFINRFTKKFDQNEIPLIIALDPEMGVGYDDLEHGQDSDDFVSQYLDLKNDSVKVSHFEILKEEIKNGFLIEEFKQGEVVFLDKLKQPSDISENKLPNSISTMITVVDDLICIEQLGGASANSLNGRFTIANNDVYDYTKQLATIEKKANPDILFFDVAYMVETNVDNINRRKLIYDYQLSILNFDTSEDPLSLNDIMVSVKRGELILRSKIHNKRIIPKISSAYNYARSDLSAFRLLCDLQHQGLQSNLLLKLEHLFPGLNYYPRFQYKNFILSLAKWKVNQAEFFAFVGKDNDIDLGRTYLRNLGVSHNFRTGKGDQTLSFGIADDVDMGYFIQYMQKQKFCYLEEFLVPSDALVVDEKANRYHAQFILALTHEVRVYDGIPQLTNLPQASIKRSFPPGSDWVYFEIFCHQQRSDSLLVTAIKDYLTAHKQEIKSWFFIRYSENGDHIRLRVLLADENRGEYLIRSLNNHLDEELRTGLVADISIKTYRREIERYGNDLMEDVEMHFCTDSTFVLSLIETGISVNDKYKLCSLVAIEMRNDENLFRQGSFDQMILALSNSFNGEHKMDAVAFKKLNVTYQVYKNGDFCELTAEQKIWFTTFCESLKQVLQKCEETKRAKLFGDLMHMHVNRLFNKNQRVHEMVMYYYLLKDLQRMKALSK